MVQGYQRLFYTHHPRSFLWSLLRLWSGRGDAGVALVQSEECDWFLAEGCDKAQYHRKMKRPCMELRMLKRYWIGRLRAPCEKKARPHGSPNMQTKPSNVTQWRIFSARVCGESLRTRRVMATIIQKLKRRMAAQKPKFSINTMGSFTQQMEALELWKDGRSTVM